MQRYVLIRLGQALVTLFCVLTIVFFLARLTGSPVYFLLPADPSAADVDELTRLMGLDKPVWEQFVIYLNNVAHGEFGMSIRWTGRGVLQVVADRLEATLQLAGAAMAVAVFIGVTVGVYAAVKRDTFLDYGAKTIALLGQSLPGFWLGIMLIWLFAVTLGVLPVAGRGGLDHIVMPAITMGLFQVAAILRLVRSSMLEVLDSEYVKLARLKGLRESVVIWKHCLRNAAIAPLTYFAIIAAGMITGSVVTETVFAWPGVGLLAIQAVQFRDFPLVQAIVVLGATVYITMNLIVDVLYSYLDPRIRYD